MPPPLGGGGISRVQHDTLVRHGAVSRETALEMAQGVRRTMAGSFPLEKMIGIFVTGIAGPGGGTPAKPVGLVWIALCAYDTNQTWQFIWQGDRLENKKRTADQTFQLLADYLEQNVHPAN
jgi:PncC family amidohydrolase